MRRCGENLLPVLKEWTAELRQPHIHGNRLRTNFIPSAGFSVPLEKVDKGRMMRAEVADARPVSAAPLTNPPPKYQWTLV